MPGAGCFRPGRASAARGSLAADVDGAADLGEGAVGVGAEHRDRGDAHHDDQGQHHGVLDRRRAVFVLQEIDRELTELTHGETSSFLETPKPALPVAAAGPASPAGGVARAAEGVVSERTHPPARGPGHDADAAVFRATLLNTLLAFEPRVVIATKQTTTIRAS